MKIKEKHIKDIIPGDLVLCSDNIIRTVSTNNIKKSSFIGITIWGDCYALGYKPVKVIENYSSNISLDL